MQTSIPGKDEVVLAQYISRHGLLPALPPWELTQQVSAIVESLRFDDEWIHQENVHIHRTASVSPHAFLDGTVVVGPGSRVAHGAHLRDGAWLDENVNIGTHCEIKSSFVFARSRIAHLNYVGNSIIGEDVNIEAGAVIANHWNERDGEEIVVVIDGERIATGVTKFGALIGDNARIGANSVTSPGTILKPGTVVPRLHLVEQNVDRIE